MALAACIIIGVYMKLIHDENRKAQNTENVMEVLEANDNSTAQIDKFSTSIQTIKEQANRIVSELPDCKEVGKEGDRLRYYDSNGKLVKALIYPETSEDEFMRSTITGMNVCFLHMYGLVIRRNYIIMTSVAN